MPIETILLPLRNEGTAVWRPVRAEQLGDGTFRVLGPVPEDEEWEYKPGEVVTAKRRVFDSGEEGLVAERPVVGPSNQ